MTLTIGIDARIGPANGGVAQATWGLIHALGQLEDDGERYAIIIDSDAQRDSVLPYLGRRQQVVRLPSIASRLKDSARRVLGPFLPAARKLYRLLRPPILSTQQEVARSNGRYEALALDVLHFPHQSYISTSVPSIYNPHDLQHRHLPQFFTFDELQSRERIYRTACEQSTVVVAATEWIRNDLMTQYALPAAKVQIIPWGAPTQSYGQPDAESVERVRTTFNLPPAYAIYPAVTWPHKNHVRLFEALALARDRHHVVMPLVCTGSRHEPYWPEIQRAIDRLGLHSQVFFLGFVNEKELRALYAGSRLLVMPSLFESDSFPVYEAWLERTAVVSSNVTAMPDQIGDAAVLFDPYDPHAICEAMTRVWGDADLRRDLIARGTRRLAAFDWARTARAYRALYRRTAGLPLTRYEEFLLGWNWMREPEKPKEDISSC